MRKWFLEILQSPDLGNKLTLSDCNTLTDNGNGFVYPICNNVPSFLPQQEKENNTSNANFRYIDHYTKDAEVFDYHRDKKDKLTEASVAMLQKTVIKQAPKNTGLLLDVGCGCAYVAKHFVNTNVKVVSLDIAQVNAEKALQKYPAPNHAAVVADVYALPFAENTFDCIIASEIIEHTIDPQKFIAALRRVLKPEGTLIISTPYKERIEYSLCIHCNCATPKNAHLHSFDKNNMHKLHTNSSQKIEKIILVGNKLLLHTRAILLIKKMGYTVWKCSDKIANKLLPKAQYFIIKSKKTNR